MRYVTKPVEIEAIKWTGDNKEEIQQFVGDCCIFKKVKYLRDSQPSYWCLSIDTLEGEMRADINDYIIKGLRGEFYPCKPDVFHKKYAPASEDLNLNLANIEAIIVTDIYKNVIAMIDNENIVEHAGYKVIIDYKS